MVSTILSGLLAHDPEEDRKIAAWGKASVIPGCDPNHMRRDAYGWTIVWSEYGNRESVFGWEVDHAIPTILGGGDGSGNLRALHWRVNAGLGGVLSSLGR
jgi:hypothetical protein